MDVFLQNKHADKKVTVVDCVFNSMVESALSQWSWLIWAPFSGDKVPLQHYKGINN